MSISTVALNIENAHFIINDKANDTIKNCLSAHRARVGCLMISVCVCERVREGEAGNGATQGTEHWLE